LTKQMVLWVGGATKHLRKKMAGKQFPAPKTHDGQNKIRDSDNDPEGTKGKKGVENSKAPETKSRVTFAGLTYHKSGVNQGKNRGTGGKLISQESKGAGHAWGGKGGNQ